MSDSATAGWAHGLGFQRGEGVTNGAPLQLGRVVPDELREPHGVPQFVGQ